MTLRRFMTYFLAIAVIAGLEWLLIPGPTALKSATLPDAPWKIPVQPASGSKDALVTLTNINLWGKLADTVQASENEPEWHFLGTMIRGNERHVIIKKDNQPEQTLVPGDSLPGGSKILSIENDRLCLLINGQKRSLYIYPEGRLSGKMGHPATSAYRSAEADSRARRTRP